MKKMKDTRYMVTLAMMAAIVVLLANTPLGMIQLPVIKATTVHIPVIIGSILLGSTTGLIGALKALWVSVGCRVMIGVVSGWVHIFLKNLKVPMAVRLAVTGKNLKVPMAVRLAVTGFVGSMTNTIFVMGSIYILFAQQYAEVKNVGMEAVFGLVMATVATSGVPEAIAAAILVTVITAGILKSGVLRQNAAIAG